MEKLKIAVQKSGRLSEKSIQLLQECNIKLTNGNRKLISVSSNFPIEILYLRDDDIPQYINDGVADIGIVGENEMLEKNYPLTIYQRLGFAKCRLSLAIPKSENYDSLSFFQNKKIATSYPFILKSFLEKNNINAEIHQISGSVEISPSIGLADAIFDIVSSGSTLISNGLKEVEQVVESEAVMIGKNQLKPEKQKILDQLLFRMKSVQKAKSNKYILLNAPNERLQEIINIIPGMKSPTIMPLVDENWCSLHSVVQEE
ncbi:MAG: ATP phosphoribosyltransferase, partial [Bacteroidota bacterium]